MLGLLRACPAAGRRFAVRAEPTAPLGVPAGLFTLETPGRAGDRRRERALGELETALRRAGIRTLLFHRGFPHREYFLSRGFRAADCQALLAVKAGEIAACLSPRRGRALLTVRRADGYALRAVSRLAADFRYVTLDCPPEAAERLTNAVSGLGAAPEPLGFGTSDADAAVFFAPPNRPVYLPARCRVVRLCPPTPLICGGREAERFGFTVPERRRKDLPEGFYLPAVLSDAVESGKIPPEEVKITAFP